MTPRDRLIVALDFSSRSEILRVCDELHDLAGLFKIGLQAFTALGPSIVSELVGRGRKVFLDLKLHDIPNTVEHAVAAASSLGATMLTVHAAGGARMMAAAAKTSRAPLLLLGVTVLTSLDGEELSAIGWTGDAEENAVRLARLAQTAGLGGVVASPREIHSIRRACGSDLVIVTPGIRGTAEPEGDQRRTMSAAEAVQAGADFVVVGRPITAAPDRRAAALRIVEEISREAKSE